MQSIMKVTYPALFTLENEGYSVEIPDFPLYTQGNSLIEAVDMARSVIGLEVTSRQDDGERIPAPSDQNDVQCGVNEFVSIVDVDLSEYRKQNDTRTVRRVMPLPNCVNA